MHSAADEDDDLLVETKAVPNEAVPMSSKPIMKEESDLASAKEVAEALSSQSLVIALAPPTVVSVIAGPSAADLTAAKAAE